MRLRTAIKYNKLLDKRLAHRRVHADTMRQHEKFPKVFKSMTVKEIDVVMEFYWRQLKEHIERMDDRVFPVPGIGMIYLDKGFKKWLDKKNNRTNEV